jgi:hypothetical protein
MDNARFGIAAIPICIPRWCSHRLLWQLALDSRTLDRDRCEESGLLPTPDMPLHRTN